MVLVARAADYGPSSVELWASFDHVSRWWKTSAHSLLEASPKFSETLPRSGMTRNGTLYRLQPLTRPIYGKGSGSLLPTPTAGDAKQSGSRNTEQSKAHPGISLTDWSRQDGGRGRQLPTPRASEWKGTGPLGSKSHSHRFLRGYLDATMQEHTGATGRLNPRFVEAMMGLPIGFTECEFSALPSSRRSRK